MTVNLEKVFFGHILGNRKFITIVETHFFKNKEIQFVYKVLKDYLTERPSAQVPTPKQIWEMVSLVDQNGLITKEILKSVLSVDMKEYDYENFILPKFNAWVLSNKLKSGTVDIIDKTINQESGLDYEDVLNTATEIRDIVNSMAKTDFVDEDDELGSDFDDPHSHIQDSSKYKIPSGFTTIDQMLGGGWDIGTLNLLMASTNNGKSLWMQNLAVKTANMGYNVLYITLEMSERKVIKRLGAMRLKIPINDYDNLSNNIEYMQSRIKNLKGESKDDLFNSSLGKIYTKFWAAGTASVQTFDDFIRRLEEKRGVKIDFLIVDYITLIAPVKGVAGDNLYIKGKYLAEGLRALASKYKIPVLTSVQVSKDAWNASDITLEQVPESKAIAETADTFFAIIRTEEMKRQGIYRFKLLKQRDGDFLKFQVKLDLNSTFLTLENDMFPQ